MQSSSKCNLNTVLFQPSFEQQRIRLFQNFAKEASTGGAGAPLCIPAINMLLYVFAVCTICHVS